MVIISSGKGLSSVQHYAIAWTNDDFIYLSIGISETSFSKS